MQAFRLFSPKFLRIFDRGFVELPVFIRSDERLSCKILFDWNAFHFRPPSRRLTFAAGEIETADFRLPFYDPKFLLEGQKNLAIARGDGGRLVDVLIVSVNHIIALFLFTFSVSGFLAGRTSSLRTSCFFIKFSGDFVRDCL